MPRIKTDINKFKIVRDTREKVNFWKYNKTEYCDGVIDGALSTGDYSIVGLEHIFSIERKASTGELAGNVTTKQFENELKRSQKLKHFFLILEFNLEDILKFPYNSTIPPRVWPKLRVTSGYLLKRIIELEIKYNVKIIFAGTNSNAKEIAREIFKQMWRKYEKEVDPPRG